MSRLPRRAYQARNVGIRGARRRRTGAVRGLGVEWIVAAGGRMLRRGMRMRLRFAIGKIPGTEPIFRELKQVRTVSV